MMEEMNQTKKENKLGFFVLVISIVICLITVSYAIWSQVYRGKKENVLTTGTLVLKLNDRSKELSLLNAIPLSDGKGMQQEAYTFSLQNTGTVDANYRLSIIEDDDYYTKDQCSNKKLDWNYIRYALTEESTTPIIDNLSKNSGKLKEDTIKSGEEIEFTLKLWLHGEATTNNEMGKHFHGKIKIEAIQGDQVLKE